MSSETKAPLLYKGRPLMRKDNFIYYGSMADPYIVMMQVMESKQVGDAQIATKVAVQLQKTDPSVKSKERVVLRAERDGLFAALECGSVWLERYLKSGGK